MEVVCACQRRAAARYSFSKRTRISRGGSTRAASARSASGSSSARSTLRAARWTPGRSLSQGSQPIGLLVLDGLLVREATVGDHPCAELLGPGDLLRAWDDRDAEDPAAAHGRVDRADALPARDHRPGARRAGRAVARDLRRAASSAPRAAPSGSWSCRRSRTSRASTTGCWRCCGAWPSAGAACVPGGVLVSLRLPAPHARRHGRRPPPVGHDGAGPADRARGDRAPPRRRLAAAGRPAGAAHGRPRRRLSRTRCASPRGSRVAPRTKRRRGRRRASTERVGALTELGPRRAAAARA